MNTKEEEHDFLASLVLSIEAIMFVVWKVVGGTSRTCNENESIGESM